MSKVFTTNRSLQDVIELDFQPLLETQGLTLVTSQNLPQFNDAVAVYRSPDYLLRFVRDRGSLIVQLAPPLDMPEEPDWNDLDSLVEFLIGNSPEEALAEVKSFEEENVRLRQLLQAHRSELAEFLQLPSWPNNKHSIDKYLHEKLESQIQEARKRKPAR
jgi:hypothetical protein